jgi:hypothetical protein
MMKKYKLDGNTQREFTPEEYAQAEIDEANWQAELEAKAQIEAKRIAALAKLEALGLDEDDLKALGL